MKIQDATGSGYEAKVNDKNRLLTAAVTTTEDSRATEEGDSYNINTGLITITATTAILYFKNNEESSVHIEAVAAGVGTGSFSDTGYFTIIKNPTTGTLISGASAVDMNQNRNFGSSNTLAASLAYKGATGNTITDGDDVAILMQGSGRIYAGINFILTKGDSIAIKYTPNLSSGDVDLYAALILHSFVDN